MAGARAGGSTATSAVARCELRGKVSFTIMPTPSALRTANTVIMGSSGRAVTP
jgi:hypothetical protein